MYPTDNVPHLNDVEAWDRICFGRATDSDLQLPALPIDDSAEMTQLSHNICSKIMALEQVCWLQLQWLRCWAQKVRSTCDQLQLV